MADVAATGDLSRRVPVRSRAWDDEDARLLATAFNALTESIARFRREETQKERLSSLGRLSTVVAHEIRNPLMIISASLRTLRREQITPAELHEAVADIDEETARLNRHRDRGPRFRQAAPLRARGRRAQRHLPRLRHRSNGGRCGGRRRLRLDPDIPPMVTDAERLRTALVNILSNARAAVHAARATPPRGTGGAGPADRHRRRRHHRGHARARRAVRSASATAASGSRRGHGPHLRPVFHDPARGTGLGLPSPRTSSRDLAATIRAVSRWEREPKSASICHSRTGEPSMTPAPAAPFCSPTTRRRS
jgi:nitrogen-specific signal transduction histidine kinase